MLFVFSFSASAVVVDGYVGNAEWLDSPRELLFLSEKDSGNALNMGIVFLVTEFQNNRLHLAVKAGGKNCTHGSLAGVRFVLGSYGTVHLDFREPKNPAYDGEKLHAVGAMADASEIDIPNEFSAELSLLLKTPAPERMVLTLWLMDSQGEPSLPFAFTLVNPYAVVSTTTAPTMTSAYNTTTTRSTTTRTTTTRTTTTR
ncbi:MAG: hypothetical protein FWG82_00210, partial [Oscillospiraceae bacterium]|nr:hypothetical protein [Oscillospiraceae bacterium]